MRPTDENQHGSTRPNLMSPSRPGSGEDNILAMLERDAGRGRGSQFSSHPRMAWYAGAGAVVVAMVAALGWLAWENATKERALPLEMTRALPAGDIRIAAAQPAPAAAAAASLDAAPPLPAAAAAASIHQEQLLPAAAAAALVHAVPPTPAPAAASGQAEAAAPPTAGAAIIDGPAAPHTAPVLLAQAAPNPTSVAPAQAAQPSRLPPLVLLPREEIAPKRTPAAPVAAPARPKPAVAAPPKAGAALALGPAANGDAAPASRRTTKAVDAAPVIRHAARADAAPAPRQPARADAASRPDAKAPPRRPSRPVVARAKKAPTLTTAAGPATSTDASADTDVALISAIIMHSSKHAAERAKAEAEKDCDGAKCAARPAAKR